MNKDDEVYALDGVPAGQIIRGPAVVTETVTTHSGRETTYHLGVGQQPTTVGQQPTFAAPPKGVATVAQQATVPLRDRLRAALRRHIDPNGDTMPAIDHDGFFWVPVDGVIADLVAAIDPPKKYPLATHPYQGEGFLFPCTAVGYGSMCGSTQYDHVEEQ